jgi:hypothetical protein
VLIARAVWCVPITPAGASANLILMARPPPGAAAPQPWGPTYVPISSEALAGAKVVHLAGEDSRADSVVNVVAQVGNPLLRAVNQCEVEE